MCKNKVVLVYLSEYGVQWDKEASAIKSSLFANVGRFEQRWRWTMDGGRWPFHDFALSACIDVLRRDPGDCSPTENANSGVFDFSFWFVLFQTK